MATGVKLKSPSFSNQKTEAKIGAHALHKIARPGATVLGVRVFFDHQKCQYRGYRTLVGAKSYPGSYRRQPVVVPCVLPVAFGKQMTDIKVIQKPSEP